MKVICEIWLVISGIGQPAYVEGIVLSENKQNFIVDFSAGVKRYPQAGPTQRQDMRHAVIDKGQCR